MQRLRRILALPVRYHFWGSLGIVLFVSAVLAAQITDRYHFASSELWQDVVERWGAPIVQPVPSVRFVESGSVFNALESMPLASQTITVDATMNYRKRGLAYFSGFDFHFEGAYEVRNEEGKTIDVVFVYPIQMGKNRILLSGLEFRVNGESQAVDLAESEDRLVWTGRLEDGEALAFGIAFEGRGLDAFTYQLDPALPVRDFHLAVSISGGDQFDYEAGVVPASTLASGDDRVSLVWDFPALESGVPVGVRLPSEKSYDQIIATMIRRSWATFLMFFVAISALGVYFRRRLRFFESYLLGATYVFFYVLLAYLAAYVHFYAAYVLTTVILGALVLIYLRRLLGPRSVVQAAAIFASFQLVPTLAVILQGYTGLIYTLETLAALVVLMLLSTQPFFRDLTENLISPIDIRQEDQHAISQA